MSPKLVLALERNLPRKPRSQIRAITEMLNSAIGFVHLLGGLVIDMLCVVVFS